MATYNLTQGIPSEYAPDDILNCPYSGNKITMQMLPGTYKLEVWGAEGGYRTTQTYSGKGGYSVGTISFEQPTTLYLYAGASGRTTGANKLGFNGGGYRASQASAGGDGSDIRIEQDSLYARVIVAGGGGSDGAATKQGMYGGGEVGGSSTQSYTSDSNGCGKGGTQTYSGYSISYTITTQSNTNFRGGFGFGGSGLYASSGYGGAGGGGWYGGSGTNPDSSGDDDRGGGGGSGYIYTSATAGNYPSGCLLNSTYYLTNASMISGNAAMTSPTGASETGHYGDGYVRITVISIDAGTKCNFYDGSTLIATKYLEAGTDLSTVEVKKASLYQWKNSSGTVVTTVPDTKEINLYGTLIKRIPATYYLLSETIPSTFVEGDVIECDYSGEIKTLSLGPGYYRFEAWGAQGGNAQYSTNPYYGYGGNGGYASGIHRKSDTSTYYLCVGGVGTPNSSTPAVAGGYNGGGQGYQYSGGGGGATHIATTNGLLSTFSNDLSRLILVAGGGGGGSAYSTTIANGGAGGGYVGCSGVHMATTASYTSYQGNGGTQTEGGCCYSRPIDDTSSGKFGQGGRYYSSYAAGGGAGFYGGSGAYQYGGGGGGSSWASPTALIHPRLIPGNNEKYGKTLNGYIRITFLGTTYHYNDIDATTSSKPKLKKNDVIKCPYTGNKVNLILPKGKYMIECYGASGGNTGYSSTTVAAYNHSNGKGGYSHGTVTLSGKTNIYLYVGGKGEDGNATNTETSKGGFNGGGNGGSYYAGAGGGATDVRIGTDDLHHRLIIAGGGGGAAYYSTTPVYGGDGGGQTGLDGTNYYNVTYRCTGGTQTEGGTVTTYSVAGNPGELGQGGKCADATLNNYCTGGGGGGGLYGGAGSGFYAGSYYYRSGAGGGGGSGFTFTESVPECTLDTQYILEDAFTCASGYDGNGLIIITVLEASSNEMYCKIDNEWKLIDSLYVKINNEWKEVKEIYTLNNTWKNIV